MNPFHTHVRRLTIALPMAALLLAFLPGAARSDDKAEFPKLIQTENTPKESIFYYLVPENASDEQLLALAKKIPLDVPVWQILFVDDAAGVDSYAAFVKTVNRDDFQPNDKVVGWSKEHIVANIQKAMGGHYVLYRGKGIDKIGRVTEVASN